MVPLLSASTSLIISCSSDSDGFWPRERMTVPSSLVVIWPVRGYLSICFNFHTNLSRQPESLAWVNAGGKIALTIAILVLYAQEMPNQYLFGKFRAQSTCRVTHKQGECLLVLGDLLFSQRVGLNGCDGILVQETEMGQCCPPRRAGASQPNEFASGECKTA